MIDLGALAKITKAFKVIDNDKSTNRLSQAYLIVCQDAENLEGYMRYFAKQLLCSESVPCESCRHCSLINSNAHQDVFFYPTSEKGILTEDINAIISESYVRPIESEKKVFVLSNAQTMNAVTQNKLLKTLEEPPKNVYILIGTTSEQAILPTVKSRVKKVEISPFSKTVLINALIDQCKDREKLENAVACSDGTLGKTLALYQDQNLKNVIDLGIEILTKMQSSKDVLEYSTKIIKNKTDLDQFFDVLDMLLRDTLVKECGDQSLITNPNALNQLQNANFKNGALISIISAVTDARKRKQFNANQNMLIEWLLFKILEEKFRWQKL